MNITDLDATANKTYRYPLFSNLGTEMYGAGVVLRRYGFYPKFLPLWVSATHSINLSDEPSGFELDPWFAYSLVYSDRFKSAIQDKGSSKAFKIMAPFAIYKRLYNITKSPDVKGTIAFYDHSLSWADTVVDYDAYVESLLDLPIHMQPVTVCLHYMDVQKNVHQELMRRGLQCVTIGHSSRPDFIETFYETVRHYKFAVSNNMSTALLYCCDLGIPSSVYGVSPREFYFHRSYLDKLSESLRLSMPQDVRGQIDDDGLLVSFTDAMVWFQNTRIYKVSAVFEKLSQDITFDQKMITIEDLGLENGITRFQAALVFYTALFLSPIKFFWLFISRPGLAVERWQVIKQKIVRDWKREHVS